jgi:ABC-type sulfate transport system substrate-binding protein
LQIADFLNEALMPKGVAVVVEALPLCTMMRGVKKHNARLTTSAVHGYFRSNLATRQEFFERGFHRPTMDDVAARAEVSFDDGNVLRIKSDSLIVIGDLTENADTKRPKKGRGILRPGSGIWRGNWQGPR